MFLRSKVPRIVCSATLMVIGAGRFGYFDSSAIQASHIYVLVAPRSLCCMNFRFRAANTISAVIFCLEGVIPPALYSL